MTDLVAQALYSGVLTGSAYALIALGLALVFGTMRIINLAHGELVLLAAYIAYTCESQLGLFPLLSIPAAIVVVCVATTLTWYVVGRIERDHELNSLLLTYGIGVMLTNGALLVWRADIRSTKSAWLQEPVVLGPLYAMRSEVLFFVVSVVLIGALWWWLTRTWAGRALRATASNRDAAMLMGIDPRRVQLVSFLVAGLLAAFAGTAIYTIGVIQPSLGISLTVKAFIITVLAGMGSVPGVLAGALLLGVTESLTTTFASSALQELAGWCCSCWCCSCARAGCSAAASARSDARTIPLRVGRGAGAVCAGAGRTRRKPVPDEHGRRGADDRRHRARMGVARQPRRARQFRARGVLRRRIVCVGDPRDEGRLADRGRSARRRRVRSRCRRS
jgi:branched-chain amino acid transport system permease protein